MTNDPAACEEVWERILEELLADAYSGMNWRGIGATEYTDVVNQYMTENGMGKGQIQENGTRQTNGPPATLERYSADEQSDFRDAVMRQITENWGGSTADTQNSIEKENTTGKGDASNQKIDMYMSDTQRADILRNKKIIAPVYEGEADEAISRESDLRTGQSNLIKKALTKIADEFKAFKGYLISSADLEVELTKGTIKETSSKKIDPETVAKLLPILDGALENAVGIECHENRYFYDSSTVSFENLIGGYIDGENLVPIRFGLKHDNTGKATLYVVIDQSPVPIKNIKAEVVRTPGANDLHQSIPRSAFKFSIPEVLANVKSKDMLRYIPDDFLSEDQRLKKWQAIAETIEATNDKNDKKYRKFISEGKMQAVETVVKSAAKAAGYTELMYHGSRNGGGITEFRDWSYFTKNKQYAERYAERDNPDALYSTFVKMENTFDTRNAEHRKLFESIRQEYGLGEIQDTGLPDWTDGYDIADYIDENGLDFDSIVLDEGGDLVNGVPVSRGLSYVIRKSAQIKSADPITYDDDGNVIPISKRFDTEKNDIRYSWDGEEDVQNTGLPEQATKDLMEAIQSMSGKDIMNDEKLRSIIAQYTQDTTPAPKPQTYKVDRANLKKAITSELGLTKEQREQLTGILNQYAETGKPPKRETGKPKTDPKTEADIQVKATTSIRNLKRNLQTMFSIPAGSRAEVNSYIDRFAQRIVANEKLTYEDRQEFFRTMYEAGMMEVEADAIYAEGRSYMTSGRIYVNTNSV